MADRIVARIPALTIWRPWTTAILLAKGIENRGWATNYRGPIWLHAAKRFDPGAIGFAARLGVALSTYPDDHPTGIVGLARLVAICHAEVAEPDGTEHCDCGPWGVPGAHHWQLTNIRAVTPVPCNGAQGLWWPPANLTDQAAFIEGDASVSA